MKELMHGKVKTLYDTDDPQKVLIKYEDKVTAFDGKMVDYPESKGSPLASSFKKNSTIGGCKNCPSVKPDPLREQALLINGQLQVLFTLLGIDLVDFKLEFGYDAHGDLYLADELSPDSMRLWKKDTKERFDKDLFRKDEGDIVEAYKYILQKLRQFA